MTEIVDETSVIGIQDVISFVSKWCETLIKLGVDSVNPSAELTSSQATQLDLFQFQKLNDRMEKPKGGGDL